MIYELIPTNSPICAQIDNFDFTNPPVNPLDLVSDLAETMLHNNGIGLSANQCGLPYRVFVMYGEELIPCFNPRIVDMSAETVVMEEGCLSHPGLFVKIKRPRRIKVRYTEPNGHTTTRVFDGITARVFQHELDHLNGVNYQQRANKLHLEQARKKKKKANASLSTQARSAISQLNI
jgi:peptide deformylase